MNRPSIKRDVTRIWCMYSVKCIAYILVNGDIGPRINYILDFAMQKTSAMHLNLRKRDIERGEASFCRFNHI